MKALTLLVAVAFSMAAGCGNVTRSDQERPGVDVTSTGAADDGDRVFTGLAIIDEGNATDFLTTQRGEASSVRGCFGIQGVVVAFAGGSARIVEDGGAVEYKGVVMRPGDIIELPGSIVAVERLRGVRFPPGCEDVDEVFLAGS